MATVTSPPSPDAYDATLRDPAEMLERANVAVEERDLVLAIVEPREVAP
jgi:hypothetical protein